MKNGVANTVPILGQEIIQHKQSKGHLVKIIKQIVCILMLSCISSYSGLNRLAQFQFEERYERCNFLYESLSEEQKNDAKVLLKAYSQSNVSAEEIHNILERMKSGNYNLCYDYFFFAQVLNLKYGDLSPQAVSRLLAKGVDAPEYRDGLDYLMCMEADREGYNLLVSVLDNISIQNKPGETCALGQICSTYMIEYPECYGELVSLLDQRAWDEFFAVGMARSLYLHGEVLGEFPPFADKLLEKIVLRVNTADRLKDIRMQFPEPEYKDLWKVKRQQLQGFVDYLNSDITIDERFLDPWGYATKQENEIIRNKGKEESKGVIKGSGKGKGKGVSPRN